MSLYHKGNVAKYFLRPENYNKASRRKFGLLFARDPHNEHQLQFRVYWTDADGNNMTFQESYTGTSTATYYPAVSMHYGGDKITLHQLLWNTDIPHRYRAQLSILHEFGLGLHGTSKLCENPTAALSCSGWMVMFGSLSSSTNVTSGLAIHV